MIINHQYKFIFFKTKKTAGTSMELALSKYCGPKDVISPLSHAEEAVRFSLTGLRAQNYYAPIWDYTFYDILRCAWYRYRKGFYDHIPVVEAKPMLPAEVWDSYFKFAIDRNPWDKVISFYFWSGGDTKYGNIEAFLHHGKVNNISSFEQLSENGVLAVDRIFRYENMAESLDEISDILKLPTKLELPAYKAKSEFRKDKRHYLEILTAKEVTMIRQMFAREIEVMGW